MHGVQKKRALAYETDPEIARVLNCVSKAALLDCVADLLREHCASIDDPVTESVARERLERVLVRRGDKWPVIRQLSHPI